MHDRQRLKSVSALLRPPSGRSAIDPFIAMDVLSAANAREAAGHAVIHMEVGQPGTPAPKAAREAARRAMETQPLGYTEALGIAELRAAIAAHYRDWYGVAIDPARVIVTTGSSAGFVLAFLALFDSGARVGLPLPGYPCYRHILKALDLEPVPLMTGAATRWMPEARDLTPEAGAAPLEGLILASPANPTGTMLAAGRLQELVAAAERQGIWLISDEIYHGLTYEAAADTALAHSKNVIVINSFSKYFSMTGWRIGWMVVPESLVRTIERLAQNLYIAPPAISQYAALGALEAHEELEGHKRVYEQNRALLLDALPKAGLGTILPADGAFYLYVSLDERPQSSPDFARRMLEEAGVAITPGLDFDPERGERFVRFSYAGTTAQTAEAARRISAWLAS